MDNKKLVLVALNIVFLIFLFSFSSNNSSKESSVPKTLNTKVEIRQMDEAKNYALVGTSKGLYYWNFQEEPVLLWNEGEVRKIIRNPSNIYLLTDKGIVFTDNLKNFEYRNEGLIFKILKTFTQDGKKEFGKVIQDLKDLEVDPNNPLNMVTCSKEAVFYTTDGAKTWKMFKNPTSAVGIKSVAIFTNPDLQIIFAHPFMGIYYRNLNKKNHNWEKLNQGLYKYSGIYEELSDIHVVKAEKELEIYSANNFYPYVYKLDLKKLKWKEILKLKDDFVMIESLYHKNGNLNFVTQNGLMEYNLSDQSLNKINFEKITESFAEQTFTRVESIYMVKNNVPEYHLNSLWLLSSAQYVSKYAERAAQKKGLYIQGDIARSSSMLERITNTMKSTGLNMIVIDMKDDFGQLRFNPEHELLKKMGTVVNPVNLEKFVREMKEQNIYLVGRIVCFKDKALYSYQKHKYAVKDRSTGKPWRGFEYRSDGEIKNNPEHWVDPYSEKVWEYNVTIARELIERGFDEVQFDYIRFPTDGVNLYQASFPFKEAEIDREGALISFLKYAREHVPGPISVDIYGANGWHRTGARTGQDVELLKNYVDVICPMYYPSHFHNEFMNYKPYEDRTYRIYYYGTLRNYYIAKKSVVIRPYLQAFKINKAYDNAYYGPGYVMNQVRGVNNSVNHGYTFWNSGSKYNILLETFSEKKIKKGKKKSKEQEVE